MEQPVDEHSQSGEAGEGRHEPIDAGLSHIQPSAEGHLQEQQHIDESAVSQKKAHDNQNAIDSIRPVRREKHWEVSFQEGLFHLDQVQRYSSLEQVNEAIEREKRKLTELSEHSQGKQQPVSVPAADPNEEEPATSSRLNELAAESHQQQQVPVSLKEEVDGKHIIPTQSLGEGQKEQEQPQQHIKQQESRVEYLYKPVDDQPQEASHEPKPPAVVEEAVYNEAIQRSAQFERRNSELEQRCRQLEQQVADLTSRLAESQSKLQDQENQPDASVEIVEPNGTEANRISPTASVKKKINDDGLKKILYAMESADKGIAIPVELPKRKKLSRKGPLFSRDFKLASNVYNIAFGEIMDLDHTWAKEEQQLLREEEKVRAETKRKFAQVLPDINVFEPSRNTMRENWQTQTQLEQGTLEQLQRKRYQLESELQNINEQIRNDGFDGKATPARYNSASDWKDHKHGTEAEAQGYSSNNPQAMYWHSLGKRSALQLERSEAAIRNKHSMEDREDNPELYPKRMSKHRTRPVSKKKKSAEELEPSRDMLRDLRDKNQQDNQDKAIQTPEIILSPGFKVSLKDLVFPMLPGKPENYHTPKELSELVRKTYTALGVPIDESNSLLVKKFKNCVWFKVFDISIVWYYEGKFYIGGWKESGFTNEGEKEGHGIQLIPNKYLYEGSFEQGRRHGHGKIKYENGDYYQGQWNNGVKEGTGRLVEANGIVYEGQMRDGRRDGSGKLTVTPLEVYEGGFVRGIKNGRGKESFKTGDHYEGDYVLGKFSGQGCYKWANGAMYKGRFHNGCRSGKGYWRSAASIPCDTYDGEYQNDKKCGRGVYTWENGVSYDGQFMNDLRQGEGIVRYPNGKVIRAMWENGARKQQLFSEQKEMYKQARKRAESASAKASMLPKVS